MTTPFQKLLFLFFLLFTLQHPLLAETDTIYPAELTLDIQTLDDGMAEVQAKGIFFAQPETVFEVLTSYDNWPTLFPTGFTIDVNRCPSGCSVVAEMIIPHGLVPLTTQLRVQSFEQRPKTLTLKLIDGDYLQYHLTWSFSEIPDRQHTLAQLYFIVQPKAGIAKWTPSFVYRWLLQTELEDHFERIQQQVQSRTAHSSPPNH